VGFHVRPFFIRLEVPNWGLRTILIETKAEVGSPRDEKRLPAMSHAPAGGNKKRASEPMPFQLLSHRSLSAGAGSAGIASRSEIKAAVQLEAVDQKIDFDRLSPLQKFLVDQILEPFDLENLVVVLWLVQSHGKARSASSALVEKDADRGYLLALEVGLNLFGGRSRYLYHVDILLARENDNGLPRETDPILTPV
jgi:hypothetical protein